MNLSINMKIYARADEKRLKKAHGARITVEKQTDKARRRFDPPTSVVTTRVKELWLNATRKSNAVSSKITPAL
jgi:hypothetical protein